MKPVLPFLLFCAAAAGQRTIDDPAAARAFKNKFAAMAASWADAIEFTRAEQAAMRAGKQVEALMMQGPADPLSARVLAAGEPSYDAMAALYPGKILDRTVLGTWSDPNAPLGAYHNEFAIYWNGAIAANLLKGRLTDRFGATAVQPLAPNTVVLFRVGPKGEPFGRVRANYSSLAYQDGYLPIVNAAYEAGGVRYRETAFADKPPAETDGWDIAYLRFEMTNVSKSARKAELQVEVILNDGGKVTRNGALFLDPSGAVLATLSDAETRFDLRPGETARLYLKIPYVPDARPPHHSPSPRDFDAAYDHVKNFWTGLLAKGARIDVPEQRINDVWRALLLQNFILADGPRFTYGSGLMYNDSTYPQENGHAAHTFAMYGFKDYANALQPWFVGMAVTREGAGRKYQNRRAMVLHHLLENWRLTGKSDLFERFKGDYYRVADEIVADRHSTMTGEEKPLSWGLLPPDKPGADVQASTQTVYVLGHNITNCQGLADFGRFLVATGVDRERGRRYLREAADFRRTLMSAMERGAIRLPDRPPFVDLQTLFFRQTPDYGPDPYDDLALGRLQGSYFHYWVDMEFHYNFFNPDDPVGEWLADYCQRRNGFVLGLTRARGMTDKPSGNVNPVYDAGYYNYRLRRGEIDRFLVGLYGRLAFGMSRYTYVSSEGQPFVGWNTQKGGYVGAEYSFPNSASNAGTLLMLRNALVLEELKDDVETGDLYLLRGAPRAWLAEDKRIRVGDLVTYFGEISFEVRSYPNGAAAVSIAAPARRPYKRILLSLRRPDHKPIRSVRLNGQQHTDFNGETVTLPFGPRTYAMLVKW